MKVIVREQSFYKLHEVETHIRHIFSELDINQKLSGKKLILLKPNMLGAHPPDRAVTTHPVILEAVIRILQQQGKEIIVGDSPGGTVKATQVWEICGYKDVCDRYNVRLIDFGKEGIVKVHTHITKLYFDKYIMECDAIINLAKMKTHSMMLYTGAVKNLYGTIPGLYKSELHKHFASPKDFATVLASIYHIVKPHIVLNIIDGIVGMEGAGPAAGNPYPFGIILASEKATAVDIVAADMMGFETGQIKYLKQCLAEDEITKNDIEIDEKWQGFKYDDVALQSVIFRNKVLNNLPMFIKSAFRSLFTYYPAFLPECKLCNVCIDCCPVHALSVQKDKMILHKSKCIKCLCCHEMCPHQAIYLKKNMLARVIFQ